MSRFDDLLSSKPPENHEEKVMKAAASVLEQNKVSSTRKMWLSWLAPLVATTASVGFFLFEFYRQREIQLNTPGLDLSLLDVSTEELLSLSDSEIAVVEEMEILENWDELMEEENG